MNYVLLRQTIQQRRNLLEQFQSFHFVVSSAQNLDHRTSGFVLVTVSQTLGFVRANTLQCRFVICHIFNAEIDVLSEMSSQN